MIEPLTSLAFSIDSGRGIYALLLGSGLSRSAQIPTGWEVTLELIKKIALLKGEDCGSKPEEWYLASFGKEPDYSDLLEALAITPAERSNALSKYFEATTEELEDGKKIPTKAHHSIAKMVAKGYFKVIISTNFDRLMEQALEMEGVSPTVISTTDAISGASPITHTKCTLIKVHGDYKDTRLRNTSLELSQYEASLNALLNRIFDEFGLIICGWSATWDTALRVALLSSPNRRYSVTWANKGQMSPEAAELVRFKGASVIEIESADDFFSSTAEKLDALERFNSPHPISTAIAVASLKKYLVEDRFRIELSELLSEEAERQIRNLQNAFGESRIFSSEEFVESIRRCEESLQTLIAVIANGAFWGRSEHSEVWLRTIVRMLDMPQDRSGYTILQNVRRYPACILLYAAGVAAVASSKYETLEKLLKYRRVNPDDQYEEREVFFIDKLTAQAVLEPDVLKKALGNSYRTPSSERLYALLRDPLRSIIPSDTQYEDVFDRFEYLIALVVCDERMKVNPSPFGPIGRFGWKRSSNSYNRPKVSVLFQRELDARGTAWGPLKSEIFISAERYAEVEKEFLEKVLVHFRDY